MEHDSDYYFPEDYFSSTERFRKAVSHQGGRLYSMELSYRGEGLDPLTIDIGWLGPEGASACVLHLAGTHGVEGFTGAAIQHAFLEDFKELPPDVAVIFVHCVNPFGMIYGRRANESNVDLNRNCHGLPENYQKHCSIYSKLHDLLHHEQLNRVKFLWKMGQIILRHPVKEVRQAIIGGQHSHPNGLYYGGAEPEESIRILLDFFLNNLNEAKSISVLEVHTGMGAYAKDTLYLAYEPDDTFFVETENLFGRTLMPDVPHYKIGFRTEGDLATGIPAIHPNPGMRWVVQEFGTYSPFTLWRDVCREHFMYHKLGPMRPNPVNLVPLFNPADPKWRSRVLSLGVETLTKLIQNVAERPRMKEQR